MDTLIVEKIGLVNTAGTMPGRFLNDVLQGLRANNKYIDSKYFYDAKGDVLFQQIMECPEYYPTRCETEIITRQSAEIAKALLSQLPSFDVIELGAGDARKSIHLLQQLQKQQHAFTYFPIDISSNVINQLETGLPLQLASLPVKGLHGEYFNMLEKAKKLSSKPKVVLFLGGNIGNIPLEKVSTFCSSLRQHLMPGDLLFIGFDLKKDPRIVLDAYNDKAGYTSRFNLNLLRRINDELDGNFNLKHFTHYPTYDPGNGTCKSYLISNTKQDVQIAGTTIHLKAGETIHTEISQKYSMEQTDGLAAENGFRPLKHFFDSRRWFLDTIWQCV